MKLMKKAMSLFLVFALVVTGFRGLSLVSNAAEAADYTELTFSDWGIKDGVQGQASYTSPVTGLNGTALNGIVTFPGNDTGCKLRIGGVSNEWCGLHIWYGTSSVTGETGIIFRLIDNAGSAYVNSGAVVTAAEAGVSSLCDTPVRLRITFDVVDTTVKFGIFVNGKFIEEYVCENSSDYLGNKFLIQDGSTGDLSLQSAIEYTQLTFSDLGIQDQTLTSAGKEGTLPAGCTSWNGLALRGNVTFPSDTQNSYIQIGYQSLANVDSEGIRIFWSANIPERIYFMDRVNKQYYFINQPEGVEFSGTPIELYMAFRFVGEDVLVNACINDQYSTSFKLTGMASTFGTGFFVNSHSASKKPITVASVKENYTVKGFSDYKDLGATKLVGNAEKYCTCTGSEVTMSGIAFEDDITFPKEEAGGGGGDSFLYLASKGYWKGIQISQGENTLQFVRIDSGEYVRINNTDAEITSGKSFRLRVEFDIAGGDQVLLRAYINGTLQKTWLWKNLGKTLGTGIYVYAAADETMVLGTPAEDFSGYDRLTPIEFNIADKTVTGTGNYVNGSIPGGFDRKYIDADVSFGEGVTAGDSIRFVSKDGWQGIYLAMCEADYEGTTQTVLRVASTYNSAEAYVYPASELGLDYDTTFNVKLYISISDIDTTNHIQNVSVRVFVNGQALSTEAFKFTGVRLSDSDQAKYLSVYAPKGSITIGTPYKNVTLADFGIDNKRYISASASGTYAGTTMDGVAVTQKVTFAKESATGSNYLKFGGKFMIGYDYNNGNQRILMWDTSGGGKHGIFKIGAGQAVPVEIADQAVTLKLTFDYINDSADVRVGLYVNDIYCGYNVFTGVADTFTNEVVVKSTDKPVLIGDEYTDLTLWDWGIEDGSISSAAENIVRKNQLLGNYDKVIFQANISFPAGGKGSNSLRIGGWRNEEGDYSWYGIHLFSQVNEGNNTNYIWIADLLGKNNSLTALYNAGEGEQAVNVKISLQFDYSGNDIVISYFVDDVYKMKATYTDAVSKIGNYLVLQTTDGKTLTYSSVGERNKVQQAPVSYDLAGGNYLVTGTKMISVNGAAAEPGTQLSTPGDYTIEKLVDCSLYTQTVSLYRIGDVNLDGTAGTSEDLAALQGLLDGKTGAYTAGNAAQYGADLDNDGKVGQKDLELMRDILDTEKPDVTLESVLKKYHVPAQTWDYLGGNGVMPIAGYFGPYRRGTESDYLTEDVFRMVKESGINLVNYSFNYMGESDDSIEALKLAEQFGIGYFINDWVLNAELDEANGTASEGTVLSPAEIAAQIGKYSCYDSFLGNHVADEPIANGALASLLQKYSNRQLKYYDGIAGQLNSYTNMLGFINVFPEDASSASIGSSYESYWNNVIQDTNPKVLSFDDYPFNKAGEDAANAGGYFRSLTVARQKSLDHNLPFWAYVQAGGDFRDDSDDSATNADKQPSEAETYWNVNTALAYGAKGIEWFTLIQPDHFSNDSTSSSGHDYTRNGLIGADGVTKTPYYAYAQRINKHIAAIDEVLMKSVSTGLIATGGYARSETTEGGTALITGTEKLTGVTGTGTTYGALVGCFDYRDTEAFYVVNYDTTAEQSVTLNFAGSYDYRQIQDAAVTFGTGSSVILTIPAGEAVLVVLEDRVVEVSDISAYRGDTNSAPDAEPGYIFAGWYQDADCTEPLSVDTKEGKAYAKFVDETVLTVKAQITAGTTADSEQADIRFVTTVDTLDYEKVGFEVTANGITKTFGSNIVYKQLYAVDSNDVLTTYKPNEQFSTTSTYFKACTIKGVLNRSFDVEWNVRPYWVTNDGTIVYGESAVKTVRMGLNQ